MASLSSSPSYIINIATDVGNGKINTGVNFYSRPISTRQVIVAAEELYTAELRDYNFKKYGAASPSPHERDVRFTCVLALVMADPSSAATRGSSVTTNATSATSINGGGGSGEKWQEFTDPSQLYQGCQVYVFDTNSPAPERGIIPRAQLVVDADRIPSVAVSAMAAAGANANANTSVGPAARNGNGGFGNTSVVGHSYVQSQSHTRSASSAYHQSQAQPMQQPLPSAHRHPGRTPSSAAAAGPSVGIAGINNSHAAADGSSPQPRLSQHQHGYEFTQQYGAGGGGGGAPTAAPTPVNTYLSAPAARHNGYHGQQPQQQQNSYSTGGGGDAYGYGVGGEATTYGKNNNQHYKSNNGPSASSSLSPPPMTASGAAGALHPSASDRTATRRFLFSQLLSRCVAGGLSNAPHNDSVASHTLHGVFVQNEMFFSTEVFSEMTHGRAFLGPQEWARLSAEFAPVLDVLYDRIAAKTQQKALLAASSANHPNGSGGEGPNGNRIGSAAASDRLRDALDALAEEEARLMARQAAIREEMARTRRELQRREAEEKAEREERAKEWDVVTKYVSLKLRQEKLKREETQINHQLALL